MAMARAFGGRATHLLKRKMRPPNDDVVQLLRAARLCDVGKTCTL